MYFAMLRARHTVVAIPRLIQMFPRYSRRSDASIGRHSSPSPGATNAYTTYRHYRICRAWRGHDRPANRSFPRCGEGRFTRAVIAVRRAVLQTAVNIVYWLPPPISQTLVTRSCRSPTANKPRAVIWRPLSSLSRSPNIPPLWRTLHFPSLRQQHVHLGQIEKDLANTRNSKLIPVAGIKTLRDKNNEVFLLCALLGRMSKLLASSV